MPAAPNLEVIGIQKGYPGTIALKGVSLAIPPGEVHALIGKNGAGKSTLVKIISGATQPDAGVIKVRGIPVLLKSPRDAFRNGIATVYQELSLIPDLSIAHNILLANLPTRWKGMIIDWERVYIRASALLKDLAIELDVRKPARTLGIAAQQMVEIAKAMAGSPSVLLLDEPTSALAQHETDSLFRIVHRLSGKGVSIIYISHRLQELRHIAHRVSVLRDGESVGTIDIQEANPRTVADMMFGGAYRATSKHTSVVGQQNLLEVRDLSTRGRLRRVNLSLRKGEILGIAGLLGSGRTDLLRAICGADKYDSGRILIEGVPVGPKSVKKMKQLGVGMLPENRQLEGLIMKLSTCDNACLASMENLSWYGVLTRRKKVAVVQRNIQDLQIAVANSDDAVASLSGGNQQKVVIAKWLNTNPRVLLCDEPSRGIDILAKQQIFQLFYQLSTKGIGTIFVSSELEELLEVCHRILVMHSGMIVREIDPINTTPQQLFEMCVTTG